MVEIFFSPHALQSSLGNWNKIFLCLRSRGILSSVWSKFSWSFRSIEVKIYAGIIHTILGKIEVNLVELKGQF